MTQGNEIHERVEGGLPKDAKLVVVTYDIFRDCYFLVFESLEWEPQAEAEPLPEIFIVWRHLDCECGDEPAAEIGELPLYEGWGDETVETRCGELDV